MGYDRQADDRWAVDGWMEGRKKGRMGVWTDGLMDHE